MDYLDFGDTIDYNKYNALVYLLRKFKKLTSNLTLGAYKLESNYGTFNFSDGFVNVGNNWILENPVTVTSNDVLKNTFYTFNFVVIDVNTTGTVNRRIVSVTEGTGETGTLELTIPSNLIGTDEVILPNFTVEVVFDEHEYYTQLPDVHLSLSVDKRGIRAGEVATITGLLTDSTSTPIENVRLPLNVDGTTVTVITDSTGEFNYAYTGTGTRGKVFVSALGESVFFYDGLINIMGAIVTGNNVSLGRNTNWLITTGDVVIYWGDGTSDTVNNPFTRLSHTYSDGLNEHLIIFDGTVTSLGDQCFYNCSGLTSIIIPDSVTSLGNLCFAWCSGLTSIIIPDSVTSLGQECFWGCSGLTSVTIPSSVTSLGTGCFRGCSGLTSVTIPSSVTSLGTGCFYNCSGLTSVTIPSSVTSLGNQCFAGCSGLTSVTISDSVTSLGKQCFYNCSGLIDYELYWETQPIQYNSQKMPVNNGTVFTIPYGTTSVYTDAGYPSNNLVERGSHNYQLSVISDKDIISNTEVATLTATLSDNSTPVSGETLNYQIKHGSTVIASGTLTTDSSGQATISYTGTGVGDVSVEVTYGTLLQETFVIQDLYFYDPLTSDSGQWNWDNMAVHTYSNNGVNFKRSSGVGNELNTSKIDLPSEFEVEITYMGGTAYTIETIVGGMGWTYDVAGRRSWGYYRTSSDTSQDQHNIEIGGAVQVGDVFKFVRQNGTLKIYQNDVEKWSMTAPTPLYDKIAFQTVNNSRNTTLKDLKVKAL